jgi:hypothetical protein
VYPDPKHWWKIFLKTNIFPDIFRENGNFSRKPSREHKIFAKTFAKTFSQKKIFREIKFCEILRKVCEFLLIFAFRENEKMVFRINPTTSQLIPITTVIFLIAK